MGFPHNLPVCEYSSYVKSVSRVSGLSFVPTRIIIEPTTIFKARIIGTRDPAWDNKLTTINGAQEPNINPPLYTKPHALFLISVGNLSDRNAGIGPNPVVVTNTNTPV